MFSPAEKVVWEDNSFKTAAEAVKSRKLHFDLDLECAGRNIVDDFFVIRGEIFAQAICPDLGEFIVCFLLFYQVDIATVSAIDVKLAIRRHTVWRAAGIQQSYPQLCPRLLYVLEHRVMQVGVAFGADHCQTGQISGAADRASLPLCQCNYWKQK